MRVLRKHTSMLLSPTTNRILLTNEMKKKYKLFGKPKSG